jgi:branched-subunit amino acid ABC-type transport system permease component
MLPFLIIGLADGSIYAIAGLGLALSYKTSGVFNFAHGAIAAGAAYVFYQCHYVSGLPWPVAAVISVLGYGTITGLIMERFAAKLDAAATSLKIAGTLGVLLIIQNLAQLHYGTQARQFAQFLPTHAFRLPGVNVEADQLIIVAIALATAAGLWALFRFTRLGVAMRAVVDDSGLLDLTGTNPARVRRASWLISTCFASLSGILIAPRLGLDAGLLTLLVVQAYAAAAIGAFTNLPLVYAGGLIVGVAQQLLSYVLSKVTTNFTLGRLPTSMPFIVLFIVLLVLPRSRLREIGRRVRLRPPPPSALSPRTRYLLAAGGLAMLAFVPGLVGAKLPIWSAALTDVVVFLSLALLVRTSNQVSLCQVGFAAVGASAFAHFAGTLGIPWLLAVVLSGLVAVPLGAFIAFPAIRLTGLFLALATLGFGILLEQVVYRSFLMFGSSNGIRAPRPQLGGLHLATDTGYYYVILAVVVACAGLVVVVERSRLGRLLRGLADSPTALATHGANVNITRVIVFCISAFLAGVGGALFAPLNGSVTSTTFPSFNSIALLAVLVVAGASIDLFGGSLILAAFFAAFTYHVVPGYFTGGRFALWLQVGFGVSAVLAALAGPTDVRGRLRRLAETSADRATRGPVAARARVLEVSP